MVKKQNKKGAPAKSDDKTLYAFLATFLSIVGFIIALAVKKEDKYVMFYAKQSLIVFIAMIVGSLISSILSGIIIVGWIVMVAVNLFVLILWVMSWVYALSGQEKEVPIIGQYARKFKF